MSVMRRHRTAAIAVAAAVLVSLAATHASAEGVRLETISAHGLDAVGVVAGVPEVGDGPAIRRYHDSGRFAQDRAEVAAAAQSTLSAVVSASCPDDPADCRAQKLAIVVDVDDTLLDWYPAYARAGFALSGSARQAGVRACVTPAIVTTRALVDQAQQLGVAVLVVSGRRNPARGATVSCLKSRGVTGWDALVLRTAKQDKLPAAVYKQRAVDRLMSSGWDIVLAIGDQEADLAGTPETARFLLPNPLYRTR